MLYISCMPINVNSVWQHVEIYGSHNKEHIFSYLGFFQKIYLLIEEKERVARAEKEGKRILGRLPTRHGAQCGS